MEGVAMWPIDTEDMRAAGAFLEIGDVVLGELLAKIEADHIKVGEIAHVRCSAFKSQEVELALRSSNRFEVCACLTPLQVAALIY